MNYLKEAMSHLEDVGNLACEEIYEAFGPIMAAQAQAAALIAIAEAQHPQFVQIGDERINADRIVRIEMYSTGSGPTFSRGINIWLDGAPCVQLKGAEMGVFLLWHDQQAQIERLEVKA